MKKLKHIIIDKETVETVRNFHTEYRLAEIKESLDKVFNKDTYSSHCDKDWSNKEIAKLDYLLCGIEDIIYNNKDVEITVRG